MDLAVRESGSGPALLWGHGLLMSMAMEDEVGLFDWSACGHDIRFIRYDARGHGLSAATSHTDDYSWPALALDQLALATALSEERLFLGGLSMGCATSLHAAVATPERVSGLVLVAPPTAWETRPRQSAMYRIGARIVRLTGLRPFQLMTRLPLVGASEGIVARMQGALAHHLEGADPSAVVKALEGAAASDFPDPDDLKTLDMPVLILAWPGDPVHPLSTAKRLAELLPHAELEIATGLGDMRTWPARVRAFFAALEPPEEASCHP